MAALELSEMQIEAMKEVGNIGAGHAATALSDMLQVPVQIGTPKVEILAFSGLASRVSQPGRTVSAVHMGVNVNGEAPCQIVVLFEEQQALSFVKIFTGMEPDDDGVFASIVESTIKEVGNIIGGAYLTALTTLTGINLIPSVPMLSTGSAENAFLALMDVPADQDVFYVQTGFEKDQPVIAGEFILIPEPESIGPLLSVFGL
jgi:chemotaxis protein CheC